MGSAAAFHLARRGVSVLGLEQFAIGHDRGSLHGLSRIIRLAYHEHPDYVPLLRRSYALWRELEALQDVALFETTGSIELGASTGPLVQGTLAACAEHGLAYELLAPDDLVARFPAYNPRADWVGVLQPDAGFLRPEASVAAHAAAARAAGADLREGVTVLSWSASGDGVTVETTAGSFSADRLVLAPGAWAAGLFSLPPRLFQAARQVVAWFAPTAPDLFAPERFPVFIVEEDGINHYGFPPVDGAGFKIGRMHHPGQPVSDPASLDRVAADSEVAVLRSFVERVFPQAAGSLLDAQACLFTNTPDSRFVLDTHPDAENVVIVSACSGHGFKFAPVVGEIAADLALDGNTDHPIDFLHLDRFLADAA
ncbi:unannotated protein [freshwater metagenome]|uniref:Unannotated protein n=1 Tax=freshwater metagenome TaxID=449393 RepID=A0A6J6Q0K7_9ZZZZ